MENEAERQKKLKREGLLEWQSGVGESTASENACFLDGFDAGWLARAAESSPQPKYSKRGCGHITLAGCPSCEKCFACCNESKCSGEVLKELEYFGITYVPDVEEHWEVAAEPEPQYFETFKEAMEFFISLKPFECGAAAHAPSAPPTEPQMSDDEMIAWAWVAEAKQHIHNLLGSAHPNKKEHPTMFEAWRQAQHFLDNGPEAAPSAPTGLTICPICDRGVDRICDALAVQIGTEWYHKPCSRFAGEHAGAESKKEPTV